MSYAVFNTAYDTPMMHRTLEELSYAVSYLTDYVLCSFAFNAELLFLRAGFDGVFRLHNTAHIK